MISMNILYFVYQCLWGMLYFQKPLLSRDKIQTIDTEKLKASCRILLAAMHYTSQSSSFRIFSNRFPNSFEAEIKAQQQTIAHTYGKGSSIDISLKPSLYKKRYELYRYFRLLQSFQFRITIQSRITSYLHSVYAVS